MAERSAPHVFFKMVLAEVAFINFNGGTLQTLISNTFFPGSNMNLKVKAGGAIIDTAGFSSAIAQTLAHDTALGATVDGGLTKNGNGTFTLTNGANSFTGNVTVAKGTLVANGGGNGTNAVIGSLGNPQIAGRQITVSSGAVLQFANHDQLGNATSSPQVTIIVNGGMVTTSAHLTTLGCRNAERRNLAERWHSAIRFRLEWHGNSNRHDTFLHGYHGPEQFLPAEQPRHVPHNLRRRRRHRQQQR